MGKKCFVLNFLKQQQKNTTESIIRISKWDKKNKESEKISRHYVETLKMYELKVRKIEINLGLDHFVKLKKTTNGLTDADGYLIISSPPHKWVV